MDLELRKKLVQCYIWSIALYGVDSWTSHVRNEVALLRVKEQWNILHGVNGRLTGLVTFCVASAFYNRLLKER
jgi:hypothetical protein